MYPILVLALLWAGDDSPPTNVDSRVARIELLRSEKARNLAPDDTPRGEELLTSLEQNPIYRALFMSSSGFGLRMGGLATGGGFALGPEYSRPDLLNGNVVFKIGASGSLRLYQKYDASLGLPHLANDHASFELEAVHRNYPSIEYYGPGGDSKKTGRSVFRLEDTWYNFTAAAKPIRHVSIGITGGYLRTNIGPGSTDDGKFVSTDRQFTESTTPGIQFQSNFLRLGPALRVDYRDRPGNPRSGGNYTVSYIYFDDLKLDTGNHRRLTAEAQQYFPFFNKKRVVALRGKMDLGYRNTNQVIPFYLQPTLGGSDDLRGFRPFRFYDNNMMVMNGEYRWEVMTGFDMAVFADAGKVFHRHAQLNFADLEKSYGFGLRFSSQDSVFLRLDTGFSREGFQVWMKFGNVF